MIRHVELILELSPIMDLDGMQLILQGLIKRLTLALVIRGLPQPQLVNHRGISATL